MIIKKPFAFLIKNFKIIHVILFLFITFVVYRFNKIVSFFNAFNNGGEKVFENMASTYIGIGLFLALLLIIVFGILMSLLMQKKKKPVLFYILLCSYYIVILIAISIAYGTINSLAEGTITQQTARLYRDVYLIISFPSYYFLAISFIRGIGFDIKKFNFNKDLEELEIKSEDNEEFEFVLGTDTYKYKRKVRRTFREFKYYVLENKLLFTIIASVILGILAIGFILNTNLFNKRYKVGDASTAGNFKITLNNSYITQKDYNGKIINNNKKYLIVDLTLLNNGSTASINSENIFLSFGSNKAYNKPAIGDKFIDLGKAYTGNVIVNQKQERCILIFELNATTNYSKYILNILDQISIDDKGETTYKYIKYKIKPFKLDKESNTEEKQINEVMYLGETLFEKSSLNIKSAEIMTSFEYKYQVCKESDCKEYFDVEKASDSATQKLLVISYALDLKENLPIKYSALNNSLDKYIFGKFLKIKYLVNDKYQTFSTSIRINKNVENKMFIDIPKNVASSSGLQIVINPRNNYYYLNINNS